MTALAYPPRDWDAFTRELAMRVQQRRIERKLFFGTEAAFAADRREDRLLSMLLRGGAQAERAKREVEG